MTLSRDEALLLTSGPGPDAFRIAEAASSGKEET